MKPQPSEIVHSFDECLEYIFGRSLGRDNPYKDDWKTAFEWIKEGLTLPVAVMVFYEQMSWMHEKFIRFGEAKDRSYLPHALKIFEENIQVAIRRHKSGGQPDMWENEEMRWRARIKSYLKDRRSWKTEMWGSAPHEKGCRAPKKLLAEMFPQETQKLAG